MRPGRLQSVRLTHYGKASCMPVTASGKVGYLELINWPTRPMALISCSTVNATMTGCMWKDSCKKSSSIHLYWNNGKNKSRCFRRYDSAELPVKFLRLPVQTAVDTTKHDLVFESASRTVTLS